MKIDHDYLKKLLEACQASVGPTFDIEELRVSGLDYSEEGFEFHMKILTDEGLIERDDGDPGFGLFKGIDGRRSYAMNPIRLLSEKPVGRCVILRKVRLQASLLQPVSLTYGSGWPRRWHGCSHSGPSPRIGPA